EVGTTRTFLPSASLSSGARGGFALPSALPSGQGGLNARDLGEGEGEAGPEEAVSGGDRGGRARLRTGRARVPPVQRPAGRAGREHVLLLRGLRATGGARGASRRPALRGLARRRRLAGRADSGHALQARVPRQPSL